MKRFLMFVFLVLAAAASANAQSISGSISGGLVERGRRARGVVIMSIPGGLHVNSNRPSSQYAIPTTVRLSAAGLRVSSPSYPRGANRKFEFSEDLINVYEGTVRFPFSFQVPGNFRSGVVKVRATVRYQACTNEVCYPPRSKEITLTARVR